MTGDVQREQAIDEEDTYVPKSEETVSGAGRARDDGTLDPARQEKAREYARIKHKLFAVDLALSALVPVLWLMTGLSIWVRDQLPFALPVQVALYMLAFGASLGLVFAPLTFYSGFVLPRRYGLSTQSLRAWLWDGIKGGLLGGVFGLVVVEIIYFLLSAFPTTWWIFAAAVMLLFTVVLANLTPVLILPLFYKLRPLQDEQLAGRLMRLAERAHTKVRGVYTMDMSSKGTAANAALMGLGNTRRVVLGDTLLDKYSHDEIEAVLAHELGHHVHHDIAKGIIVQVVLTAASFYLASVGLFFAVDRLGFHGVADIAAFPVFVLVTGAFMLLTMPIGNAYSRWIENAADEYALTSTGRSDAFISMMAKLGDQNLSEAKPAAWVEILLYDHPPVAKRIARAERYVTRGWPQ